MVTVELPRLKTSKVANDLDVAIWGTSEKNKREDVVQVKNLS